MKDFIVTGMSCAAYQARVEKAVLGVDGVDSCTVSLLTNSMRVEGSASSADIIQAVKKSGYGAKEKGTVTLETAGEIDPEAVRRAVETEGYTFGGIVK